MFYYWYELLKTLHEDNIGPIGYIANLIIGLMAAAANQLTTLPLQNHSARMQTQKDKTKGNIQTALDMYNEGGIAMFYKGADC